jgi:hypothetical protein
LLAVGEDVLADFGGAVGSQLVYELDESLSGDI